MMGKSVPVMLITGPMGVGKTSVAAEVSEQLDEAGIAHALVDIDSLRWCYPRKQYDPFRIGLAMRNLAALWNNFHAIGAERLVLADVIEERAHLLRYQRAIPNAELCIVRLQAPLETLEHRLRQREIGSGLTRHLQRAEVLAERMEQAHIEDILIDTKNRTVAAIAREILDSCGWLPLSFEVISAD
jgi:adenylylsulfate kinase-like enzyme